MEEGPVVDPSWVGALLPTAVGAVGRWPWHLTDGSVSLCHYHFSPQGSEVNVIGIGTNVVTCPKQPSMGCVYKVKTVFGPRWEESGRSCVVGDGVQLSKQPVVAAGVCGRPATNKADRGP